MAGGGLSEGVLLWVAVLVVALVLPGLGFGDAEAAEHPLTIDELVDEGAGVGGGGLVVGVKAGGELFEVGEVSVGRTRDSAWMPVLRAFMEDVALPVTEVGPVDFWALRRFASI